MMLFSWLMGFTILMTVFIQGVELHKSTIRRQKNWLASTIDITHKKLSQQEKSLLPIKPSVTMTLKGDL